VTREELEALGLTDAQLDRWYEEHCGAKPRLAESADDPFTRLQRRRVYLEMMWEWQGVSRPATKDGPKIGAYAADAPATHARFRRRG
jgi:hypothetical protein